jgi:hypothetical protein
MLGFPCPHCQAADVAPGATGCPKCGQPPVVCGSYRIEALLGKGGMGLVYDARDVRDGSAVAVKLLALKTGVDWKVYELFERGTKVLRQLDHPALPKIHAFEKTAAGGLVLVRERFDGGSLEQRVMVDHRTVGRAELRHVLEALLELLEYLHGRNPPVLHRDVKAPNIMFRSADDWNPVLVDFDTVAAPGSQLQRTTLVVSPGYTAPEQYMGEVSPASDLYGLGATMLLATTGTFPDELPRRDGVFLVADRMRHVEADVRRVVLKLVEPERKKRYAAAEEALADLRSPPAPRAERRPARPAEPSPPSRDAEGKPATTTPVAWRRWVLGVGTVVASAAACVVPLLAHNALLSNVVYTFAPLGLVLPWLLLRNPDKGWKHTPLVLLVTMLVLVVGLMLGHKLYWSYRNEADLAEALQENPGKIEQVEWFPGTGQGPQLLVVASVEAELGRSARIDVIDASDGTRLRRRVLAAENLACLPTAPGRLWCKTNDRPLFVLDGRTLDELADWEQLRSRNPGLGPKPHEDPTVDAAAGRAYALMPDGRTWQFDVGTLRA